MPGGGFGRLTYQYQELTPFLVVGKRPLCGDLSPEFALAIQQKTPPDAVWTHDQTHAITSIFGPFDGIKFLERYYLKAHENSVGHL